MALSKLGTMTTTILSNRVYIPTRKLPTGGSGRKTLHTVYTLDGVSYEVDCISSPCREKCHFSNDILGEVVFDREAETFISATKVITEDYMSCLQRTIRAWKRMFPEF